MPDRCARGVSAPDGAGLQTSEVLETSEVSPEPAPQVQFGGALAAPGFDQVQSVLRGSIQRRRFLAWLLACAATACTAQESREVGLANEPPSVPDAGLPAPPVSTSAASPQAAASPVLTPRPKVPVTPDPSATLPAATATPGIVQPATPDAASFIQVAFDLRQAAIESGDQPYGAIIVKDDRLVGLGPSRVVVNHDATAHAEMEAIRHASQQLGTADLSGCVMYSTSRPCRMCETAAYWAQVERMYYGPNGSDAGAPQYGAC